MTDLPDRATPNTTNSPAILTTKLYPPPVSAELESRVNLVARLERNRHRALTLISAPSGYGKSTLASLWLAASETSGCWVSLDEEDDDPHTFFAYVVAAVRSTFPDIRLHAQELLETRAFPPSSTVARILLNDLEQLPQRILLALDDLHHVRSLGVYEIIAELLRHPSPKLHVVLISRRDPPLPLPLLRARRQITEIRARDLRFSNAETAGFLSKVLRREIDEATAAQWAERTEGWVTAIGLAAMSLRHSKRSAWKPDNLPTDSHYLQEYLLAEVINQLEATVKEWLMTIAWLDRFCPALCTAVCQASAASAENGLTGETFVQRLRHDNLFVISLDDENRWFRLHHLFRTLQQSWGRQHYEDDEIAALHQRAGAWFAQQELPEEAIRYFIAAGDYAAAEQLLQQHRYALMNSLQWSRLARWLSPKTIQIRTRASRQGS
jgi:LuxR family maltose regulon positive regulatory protein